MQPPPDPTALLAVAAVVVVAARQLLGVTTLGTFAPALLALAVVLTPPSGRLVLGLVLGVGLLAIAPLRAARLPRVARVGVLVAVLSAASLAAPLLPGLAVGADGSALPLVATVAVVEKAAEALEGEGAWVAAGLVVRSGLVAIAALAAITATPVVAVVAEEPIAVALGAGAVCALVGCYRGLRLSELWRFRKVAPVEVHVLGRSATATSVHQRTGRARRTARRAGGGVVPRPAADPA